MAAQSLSTRVRRTQGERREQTRGALIAATIRSLAEDGYHATTTRHVAELAGSSLGALAHHFPSRLDLIAAAIDEVGRRTLDELHAQLAELPADGARRTPAALDAIWSYFTGPLFAVWLRVWVAAAEDTELHRRLVPLERGLSGAVAAATADLVPPDLPRRVWNRRLGVALDAMRGLALTHTIEPHENDRAADRWPPTRAELAHLLDRR
jgi:AcrR family transcriptional regulator